MHDQVLQILQKIMTKQDKMEHSLKVQNSQMSELLQRQKVLDQVLSRVEKKMDLLNEDNLHQEDLSIVRPQKLTLINEFEGEMNDVEENVQKQKRTGILVGSSSNSALRSTMKSINSESSLRKRKIFSIPKNNLENKVMLRVHEQNACLHHFKYQDNRIKAQDNGWYQLLMRKQIDFSKKQFFQIKILETLNKCIMIGLASLERVKCTSSFESGKAIALYLWNNYIYSSKGKEKKKSAKHSKIGDIIKVEVTDQQIKWFANDELISKNKIAPELKLCSLVPYIEMCHQGDEIELR